MSFGLHCPKDRGDSLIENYILSDPVISFLDSETNTYLHPNNSNYFTNFQRLSNKATEVNHSDDRRECNMSLHVQENVFNRLQWYYVTCKFLDKEV